MNLILTLNETRVIGALIEKEITTPEQYPLSINALTNACNQKSNRDPVLSLSEEIVQNVVDELVKKHLLTLKTGFGSRVVKCQHRFANTEFSEYQFDSKELAIICVLFLRGPQTPGELRSRTNRLCEFSDVKDVEQTINNLMHSEHGPCIAKLAREAGKRESRYGHLFSGEPEDFASDSGADENVESVTAGQEERITLLERKIESLIQEVNEIKQKLVKLPKDD